MLRSTATHARSNEVCNFLTATESSLSYFLYFSFSLAGCRNSMAIGWLKCREWTHDAMINHARELERDEIEKRDRVGDEKSSPVYRKLIGKCIPIRFANDSCMTLRSFAARAVSLRNAQTSNPSGSVSETQYRNIRIHLKSRTMRDMYVQKYVHII